MFRFKIFGENGYPAEFDGSFEQNIRKLLELAQFDRNNCSRMPSWSFKLEVIRQPTLHITLFVVEEPIEASLEHHCKHCQYVGWGQNMICNRKYHFVLPSKETEAAFLNCQDGAISTKDNLNLVQLQGHLMHGVFHSNGFGHLLCVNGMEGGSNLAGRQIMEFWDRLCTGLRARKVSLNDISQKRSMELRLLHGVAFSEPWFGRWGYKFGRGSFGVTRPMHQKAIETIQGMPLCILVHYLGSSNHHIPVIFSRYQTVSDHSLVTLGDLFRFMLELKTHLPEEHCVDSHIVEPTCRWSPKRVEMATRVIVEALKKAEFKWVSRQDVRDAARAYIGDTGLLDFVLKSLGNHVVGNYLVRRCLNPVTKVLEYCLEDVSNVCPGQQGLVISNSKMKGRYKMTRPQLMKDMLYLYKCILKDQKPTMIHGVLSAIPAAARIILDTKYLVKEYNGELPWKIHHTGHEEAGKMTLCYCTVLLRDKKESNEVVRKAMPPLECIALKNKATFNELKLEVERKFRELYWGLKSFAVESIMNLNVKGTDLVSEIVEVGQKIVLEGSNAESGIINELIYEGGVNNRAVDCGCGAEEDDGERMISCDICEVWQHSRCVQIPNNQEMPPIFLCSRCEKEIMILPSMP